MILGTPESEQREELKNAQFPETLTSAFLRFLRNMRGRAIPEGDDGVNGCQSNSLEGLVLSIQGGFRPLCTVNEMGWNCLVHTMQVDGVEWARDKCGFMFDGLEFQAMRNSEFPRHVYVPEPEMSRYV